MSKNNNINLVSLLSNWYSGATLLTILIENHSKIISNGETFPFAYRDTTRYQCSCGEYIDNCDFYKYATPHMITGRDHCWDRRLFLRLPYYSKIRIADRFLNSVRYEGSLKSCLINFNPVWRSILKNFTRAQCGFFERAIKFNNASVYLDGTKSIRRSQIFARSENINLKIINLVRDGRAFCYSYIKNKNLNLEHYSKAAAIWNDYIEMTDKFKIDFPEVSYLDVRYEDVCQDTEKTLAKIFGFIGVGYESFDLDRYKKAHILGHNMRKSFTGEIFERAEWRDKVDPAVEKEITSIMARNLQRFNYIG